MLKRFVFFVAAGITVAAFVYAQQPIVNLPVSKTSPENGKAMYAGYCAPCHGLDGKGQGPVASSLIQKPANLSLLAKNNGGVFPEQHIEGIIKFGPDVPSAHGTKDMPIWGPILGGMDSQRQSDALRALRIRNLETYVESLQVK